MCGALFEPVDDNPAAPAPETMTPTMQHIQSLGEILKTPVDNGQVRLARITDLGHMLHAVMTGYGTHREQAHRRAVFADVVRAQPKDVQAWVANEIARRGATDLFSELSDQSSEDMIGHDSGVDPDEGATGVLGHQDANQLRLDLPTGESYLYGHTGLPWGMDPTNPGHSTLTDEYLLGHRAADPSSTFDIVSAHDAVRASNQNPWEVLLGYGSKNPTRFFGAPLPDARLPEQARRPPLPRGQKKPKRGNSPDAPGVADGQFFDALREWINTPYPKPRGVEAEQKTPNEVWRSDPNGEFKRAAWYYTVLTKRIAALEHAGKPSVELPRLREGAAKMRKILESGGETAERRALWSQYQGLDQQRTPEGAGGTLRTQLERLGKQKAIQTANLEARRSAGAPEAELRTLAQNLADVTDTEARVSARVAALPKEGITSARLADLREQLAKLPTQAERILQGLRVIRRTPVSLDAVPASDELSLDLPSIIARGGSVDGKKGKDKLFTFGVDPHYSRWRKVGADGEVLMTEDGVNEFSDAFGQNSEETNQRFRTKDLTSVTDAGLVRMTRYKKRKIEELTASMAEGGPRSDNADAYLAALEEERTLIEIEQARRAQGGQNIAEDPANKHKDEVLVVSTPREVETQVQRAVKNPDTGQYELQWVKGWLDTVTLTQTMMKRLASSGVLPDVSEGGISSRVRQAVAFHLGLISLASNPAMRLDFRNISPDTIVFHYAKERNLPPLRVSDLWTANENWQPGDPPSQRLLPGRVGSVFTQAASVVAHRIDSYFKLADWVKDPANQKARNYDEQAERLPAMKQHLIEELPMILERMHRALSMEGMGDTLPLAALRITVEEQSRAKANLARATKNGATPEELHTLRAKLQATSAAMGAAITAAKGNIDTKKPAGDLPLSRAFMLSSDGKNTLPRLYRSMARTELRYGLLRSAFVDAMATVTAANERLSPAFAQTESRADAEALRGKNHPLQKNRDRAWTDYKARRAAYGRVRKELEAKAKAVGADLTNTYPGLVETHTRQDEGVTFRGKRTTTISPADRIRDEDTQGESLIDAGNDTGVPLKSLGYRPDGPVAPMDVMENRIEQRRTEGESVVQPDEEELLKFNPAFLDRTGKPQFRDAVFLLGSD